MLSIGGRQPGSYQSLGVAPDPWTNGLAVFDMNAFSWAELYDATAGPYVQPSVIKEYYNDYQKPTFSDAALAKAFAYTPTAKISSTSSSSTPNPTASPVPTGSSGGTSNTGSSGGTSNIGAIVGGVAGGVAFLVILAIIAFFMRRRRRGAKSAQYQHPNDQKPIVHGARLEKDGSARSELPNTLVTAELNGDQNVMSFRRKPVGGSLGHVFELPGS